MTTVPRDVAFQLCREIREENRGKWYRWQAWMCWGCITFSKGDMEKMCVGNDACVQVDARYALRASEVS